VSLSPSPPGPRTALPIRRRAARASGEERRRAGRGVRLSSLLLGGLLGLVVVPLAPAGASGHHAPDPGAESSFVAAINDHRASRGAPALAVHSELVGVARGWAAAMAEAAQISHNPNLGDSVRANWVRLGENVGMGGSVESLMGAFIASSEHHRIMADPAFGQIGVGVVRDGEGRMFTAHVFMEMAAEPAATAAAAAPVPNDAPGRAASSESRQTASSTASAPPPPPPAPVAAHARLDHLAELDRAAPLVPIAMGREPLTRHGGEQLAAHLPLAADRPRLIGRSTAAQSLTDGLFVALIGVGLVLIAVGARRPRSARRSRNDTELEPAAALAAYRVTRPTVPTPSRIKWVPASRAALAQILSSPFEISPSGSAMERTAPYRARRIPTHAEVDLTTPAPIDLRPKEPTDGRTDDERPLADTRPHPRQ
jgi:hypothetical protein